MTLARAMFPKHHRVTKSEPVDINHNFFSVYRDAYTTITKEYPTIYEIFYK